MHRESVYKMLNDSLACHLLSRALFWPKMKIPQREMAKKSEFANGFAFVSLSMCALFSFSSLSLSPSLFLSVLQRVCCSAARCSCTLYNNNALKMYFPELGDDYDVDDAPFVCSAKSCDSVCKPETPVNEIQVNWLLPFAAESRCLFHTLLFFAWVVDFIFVHLFL